MEGPSTSKSFHCSEHIPDIRLEEAEAKACFLALSSYRRFATRQIADNLPYSERKTRCGRERPSCAECVRDGEDDCSYTEVRRRSNHLKLLSVE